MHVTTYSSTAFWVTIPLQSVVQEAATAACVVRLDGNETTPKYAKAKPTASIVTSEALIPIAMSLFLISILVMFHPRLLFGPNHH
jgi:hypothetical protein